MIKYKKWQQKLHYNLKKINKVQIHLQLKKNQMSILKKQLFQIINYLYAKLKRLLFRIWIQPDIHLKISSSWINLIRKIKILIKIKLKLKQKVKYIFKDIKSILLINYFITYFINNRSRENRLGKVCNY